MIENSSLDKNILSKNLIEYMLENGKKINKNIFDFIEKNFSEKNIKLNLFKFNKIKKLKKYGKLNWYRLIFELIKKNQQNESNLQNINILFQTIFNIGDNNINFNKKMVLIQEEIDKYKIN